MRWRIRQQPVRSSHGRLCDAQQLTDFIKRIPAKVKSPPTGG
jgi:hypothetical protein